MQIRNWMTYTIILLFVTFEINQQAQNMIQGVPLTSRYDGVRVESVRKRRRAHNNSKIRPKDAEKNQLTSSKTINPVTAKDDNTFPIMATSFLRSNAIAQQELSCTSKVTQLSETLISSNQDSDAFTNNNNEYQQLKHGDQPKRWNPVWKYILKVLHGILGVLLLIALILPSILVYLLAPKSSQTGWSESAVYRNHCAGVSPNSLWQLNTSTTLTMILDTSQCNFTDIPLYFVSMAGISTHFCLTGYSAMYSPTQESFEIYIQPICGGWTGTNFLNASRIHAWNVNWMGFYK